MHVYAHHKLTLKSTTHTCVWVCVVDLSVSLCIDACMFIHTYRNACIHACKYVFMFMHASMHKLIHAWVCVVDLSVSLMHA